MFLINHNQSESRRGCEDGAASANHHVDLTSSNPLPVPMPLCLAQVTVHDGDSLETGAESPSSLRSQADLRHKNNRLLPHIEDSLDRANVNFGFAAPRNAVQKQCSALTRIK